MAQREELEEKLGGRILTLSRCVGHNHEELLGLIKELRQGLQTGLEVFQQSARDETEALLVPMR